MTRKNAFLLGFSAFALFAYGVLGEEPARTPRLSPNSAEYKLLRNQAFDRAGIPLKMQCHMGRIESGCMILDHIVSLCLGGTNALDNLQVMPCEAWNGRECLAGEDHEKDLDEIAACADVRAGRTTRDAAIKHFRREWP